MEWNTPPDLVIFQLNRITRGETQREGQRSESDRFHTSSWNYNKETQYTTH